METTPVHFIKEDEVYKYMTAECYNEADTKNIQEETIYEATDAEIEAFETQPLSMVQNFIKDVIN